MVAYTYTLYTRYSKKLKKEVYYARFRDPDTGERMNGISTGQTTLNDFKIWCDNYLKQGKFTEKSKMKFKDYAVGWFEWGSCPYIARILDTGGHYTPQVAETHWANLKNYTFVYLILLFQDHQSEDQILSTGKYDFENRMKKCNYEVEHILITAVF